MHRHPRPPHAIAEATADGSMRRYFYDIRRGAAVIADPDGEFQPSLDAALAEAMAVARDLIIDAVRTGRQIDDDHVLIRDGYGTVVASVPLVDALPLRARRSEGLKPG